MTTRYKLEVKTGFNRDGKPLKQVFTIHATDNREMRQKVFKRLRNKKIDYDPKRTKIDILSFKRNKIEFYW